MIRVYARLVIGAIIAISIFFLYHVLQLDFKYDFELFHPKNDPNTEFFIQFRQTFESDNDYMQIGLVNHEGVFQKDFLTKLDQSYIFRLRYRCKEEEDLVTLMEIELALHNRCTVEFYEVDE